MNAHTKEPWRYHVPTTANTSVAWIFPARGKAPLFGVTGRNWKANARRIVACVNACAGIRTEALEAMPCSFSNLLSQEFKDVVAQRDQLLAALEVLVQQVDAGISADYSVLQESTKMRNARAAIAAVKGGAA